MKTFKILFLGLCASMLFFSCAENSSELLLDANGAEVANIKDIPPGEHHDYCYSASVLLDKDHDGTFEIGWNQSSSSMAACYQKISQMETYAAQQNWAYYTPSDNCRMFRCSAPTE